MITITRLSVTGTYNNITDSMGVQEQIRMFSDAFKNTHDWVMILARNGKFVGANPALYQRFELSEDEDLNGSVDAKVSQ